VVTIAGVVASTVESNINVIRELGANPNPLIVTIVPTIPRATEKTTFKPTEKVVVDWYPKESCARTFQLPDATNGTTKAAVNAPKLSVVMVEGMVIICDPPKKIDTVVLPVNPEPVTVTYVPFEPAAGDIAMSGVTVKVAVAVLPWVSFAEITYTPLGTYGIVMV
jgi:hypothetical protein